MRFALPVALLLTTTLVSLARTELIYDQPYIGKDDPQWQSFQRIRKADQPIPASLRVSVHQATVIAIGDAGPLKVLSAAPGQTLPRYTGNVTITEVIKGTLEEKSLPLEWEATATGIEEKPSRHIFFLTKSKDGQWQAIRALFVYPYKEYAKMRLYGAYDIDRDLGLLAIRSLIDEKSDVKGLRESLLASFQGDRYMDFYSAVMLASELDFKYGGEVLQKTAAANGKNFDIDLYARAVTALAAHGGTDGIKAILQGVPDLQKHESTGRLPESIAFWSIGTHGKPDCIPAVRDFIKAHTEFVVSAAWALAEIGGDDARKTIETWRNDPTLAAQKEKIWNNGMGSQTTSVADLLNQALEKVQAK